QTEHSTVALHDALPISGYKGGGGYSDHLRFTRERIGLSHKIELDFATVESSLLWDQTKTIGRTNPMTVIAGNSDPYELEYSPLRSEEHTSELQSRFDIV